MTILRHIGFLAVMLLVVNAPAAVSGEKLAFWSEQHWHWAFYSYQSPDWDGMDYELGVEKLGWKYWEAHEQGKGHEELVRRCDNPLWDVFKKEFVEKQRSGGR